MAVIRKAASPAEIETGCVRPAPWRAAAMLCWRELVRFFRDRQRVVGSIGQPLVFWLLFGAGLHGTFRLSVDSQGAPTFLEYFLPGTVVLIILFTAIFATISIIEDRREGFLQSVLVAPVPRWSMVLGKVSGGSLIALIHAILFLGLAMWLPVSLSFSRVLTAVPMMVLCAVGLTALGFALAWRMDSSQGFHAVMSLVLLPMWLLSGGFFPVPSADPQEPLAQAVLHWCMRLNPLTYAVAGMRHLLSGPMASPQVWTPSLAVCWAVTLVFTAITLAAAVRIARSGSRADLL